MPVRATIVVRGDVQDVGYRGKVMRMAQALGLTGYVKNEPDGTVTIMCEGDKPAILRLARMVKVRNSVMHVEHVETSFSNPTGEFKGFTVRTDDLGMEMFQGFATAVKYFKRLEKGIKDVGDNVRSVDENVITVGRNVKSVDRNVKAVGRNVRSVDRNVKAVGRNVKCVDRNVKAVGRNVRSVGRNVKSVDRGVHTVKSGVDLMHRDMNRHFDRMDRKYGQISRSTNAILREQQHLRKEMRGSLEQHGRAVDALVNLAGGYGGKRSGSRRRTRD